jgi:hypothetical protein
MNMRTDNLINTLRLIYNQKKAYSCALFLFLYKNCLRLKLKNISIENKTDSWNISWD